MIIPTFYSYSLLTQTKTICNNCTYRSSISIVSISIAGYKPVSYTRIGYNSYYHISHTTSSLFSYSSQLK